MTWFFESIFMFVWSSGVFKAPVWRRSRLVCLGMVYSWPVADSCVVIYDIPDVMRMDFAGKHLSFGICCFYSMWLVELGFDRTVWAEPHSSGRRLSLQCIGDLRQTGLIWTARSFCYLRMKPIWGWNLTEWLWPNLRVVDVMIGRKTGIP
jgi:hypothetical protein